MVREPGCLYTISLFLVFRYREPRAALGWARCAHAQEPPSQAASAIAGADTARRRRPGDDFRQVPRTPPRAGPRGLALTRHSAPFCHRQAARTETKRRHQGDTGGKATTHGATHRRYRGAASCLPCQHRSAAHINKIMTCFHMGGHGNAPQTAYPGPSVACTTPPRGGHHEKGGWPSRAGH